jgi:hypothetical protein
MIQIDRDDLRDILLRWRSGELTASDVHEAAEQLYESCSTGLEYQPRGPRSIGAEILSQLSILNHQLITRDDIPAMLRFLDVNLGSELDAWSEWTRYIDGIDYQDRENELTYPPYNRG